jgi:hypothetical protein
MSPSVDALRRLVLYVYVQDGRRNCNNGLVPDGSWEAPSLARASSHGVGSQKPFETEGQSFFQKRVVQNVDL